MVRRVAICGFEHEANALADEVSGDRVVQISASADELADSWAAGPLVHRLEEIGDVEIVSLPIWMLGACGPLEDHAFEQILATTATAVKDAVRDEPIDALVVLGHGAGRSVSDLDTDATFLATLRRIVGKQTPITMVLDFHANLSDEMCELVDVIVGYRTNPHVDIADRLIEAAEHTMRLLAGASTAIVSCSTPLVLPQIAQLTTEGEPMADVMAEAERLVAVSPSIWNLSVFGGFSLADVPAGGVSVCATVDAARTETACQVVETLARRAMEQRDRYRCAATPISDAVVRAQAAANGDALPVLLADVADNPGGGAPATSTFLLSALAAGGVQGAVLGVHCDPDAVEQAAAAGVGNPIDLVLNRHSERALAQPFASPAVVLAVSDQPVKPQRGVYAGAVLDAGRRCAVDVDGIIVVISSRQIQCADDAAFVDLGIDVAGARVVVVKSRGHFRAGFDHLFAPEQIVEVDAPGVTPVDLSAIEWQHLSRPCFPLDDADQIDRWRPIPVVHHESSVNAPPLLRGTVTS